MVERTMWGTVIAFVLKYLPSAKNLWVICGIICSVYAVYAVGYTRGYNSAVTEYYEGTVKVLKKELEETNKQKDETINYLMSERDSLKSSLDESIGRLQYATDTANSRKTAGNNSSDTTRRSLEECRKFNVEGARLLRETLKEYQRESDRVNAINHLIK